MAAGAAGAAGKVAIGGVVLMKAGVSLNVNKSQALRPGGIRILAAADEFARLHGVNVTVTSGTDSHTTGRHPKGEAIDFRTRDWRGPLINQFVLYLRQKLGSDFYVCYEVKQMSATEAAIYSAGVVAVNPKCSAPHVHAQVRKDIPIWPPPV